MRTTVRLDDDVLARAKEAAARSDRTLSRFIEDALREMLSGRPEQRRPQNHVSLPTFAGEGLRSGIDLDGSGELLDLMDDDASR
jgi:predicted transcriptional regulator